MASPRHRFTHRTQQIGIAGRLFGAIFGLVFAGFGFFFLWMTTISPYLEKSAAEKWIEVPATILESSVEGSGETLENVIRFQYRYKKFVGESDRSHFKSPHLSYSEVQKLRDQLPPGTETLAYVNPAAPGEAVLFLNNEVNLLFGLFALPFMLIGLAVAGFSLFGKQKGKKEKGFSSRSTPKSKGSRNLFLALFGLPFLGMGLAFCWIGGISPILDGQAAQNWPQVPCTITKSFVESHSDSDGTTYSIEIRFTYEWNRKTYYGENYTFGNTSSSGRSSKEKVVRQYPVGSTKTCFVNPDDPYEAVITTDVGWLPWLIIPFTSIFILVGSGLIFAGLRRSKKADANSVFSDEEEEEDVPEVLELTPVNGRMGRMIGAVLFALIWNSFSAIPIFIYWNERKTGGGDIILIIVGVVFLLVGLFLIKNAIQAILALRNPLPIVMIAPGKVVPGTNLLISWKLKGSPHRLSNLEVYLEGIEIAKYKQGTNTVTDQNVFCQEQLYTTDERGTFREGSAEYSLPLATVPSMKSDNNEILWQIVFTGAIPRWPDLKESYRLPIRPANS